MLDRVIAALEAVRPAPAPPEFAAVFTPGHGGRGGDTLRPVEWRPCRIRLWLVFDGCGGDGAPLPRAMKSVQGWVLLRQICRGFSGFLFATLRSGETSAWAARLDLCELLGQVAAHPIPEILLNLLQPRDLGL